MLNALRYLGGVFSPYLLLVLVVCGLWSVWMVAPALRERGLPREAAWARRGGLLYVGLGLFGYLGVRALLFWLL